MQTFKSSTPTRLFRIALACMGATLAILSLWHWIGQPLIQPARAAPIPPPEGYPKLSVSMKTVTPTLAGTGGAELAYRIEIINTGAYTANGVTLSDPMPQHTTYSGKSGASQNPQPVFANNTLTWQGMVGFDSTVVITFTVLVEAGYEGIITNTAVIDHPSIDQPVQVSADARITDNPILEIAKTAFPEKPGANKPLTYEIIVTNIGQDAVNLPLTVVDTLPENTTLLETGPDGTVSAGGDVVTWTRPVSLVFQASTVFTYSVTIGDVPSGTIISNDEYHASSPGLATAVGEVYTTTVIDPILHISKATDPHPPGSNREMTYLLTVLNTGSKATNLTITDEVPDGVTYLNGGSYAGGVVSWIYPELDSGESAVFTYTVYIGDIAALDIVNANYQVCSAEGVCKAGEVLTSTVQGPTFKLSAEVDPIAKKPGGGGGPVTPTLTIENLGPGNALDLNATLYFNRISTQLSDLIAIPPIGNFTAGPACGDKCVTFYWVGDLDAGEVVTLTTIEGQNSIGGEEGTVYTATITALDTLGDYTTEPVTATATGKVTHFANLIPTKSAPPVIGAGQVMTYSIQVFNSGLSTDVPPYPVLTETVPSSVTLVNISHGGVAQETGGKTVIAWTLPAMNPGDVLFRHFSVLVDKDLVSGTQIINDDYRTKWFDLGVTNTQYMSITGVPVTTTVKEIGLIDSYKTVTPTLARPGVGNLLTYTIHVVNSSPVDLENVTVHDILPWQYSTYLRNAVASSGSVISDIISIDWVGNVGAYSSQQITFTVLVDDYYEGAVTNTAIISHTSLREEVLVQAVAYITNDPVLKIEKTAKPDPVPLGDTLLYTLKVTNLGQQATQLEVWDTVPANTAYVIGSASAGGTLSDGQVYWQFPVLKPGEKQILTFSVDVSQGDEVVNSDYGVTCAEGVSAYGEPVVTRISLRGRVAFLPIIYR